MLDTSVLVSAERGETALPVAAGDEIGISAVVVMEYWKGVERADSSLRRRRRVEFFERATLTFELVPVTRDTAITAARLWADLARAGTVIGAVDLLIAASALERGWALATLDLRDFGRVTALDVVVPT